MHNLFVSPKDVFDVFIWIGNYSNGEIVGFYKEEDLKQEEKNLTNVTQYTIQFRYPNFEDSVIINDRSISLSSSGDISANPSRARWEQVIRLIQSWDITDKDNQNISPTRENLSKLNPVIGETITTALDDYLEDN